MLLRPTTSPLAFTSLARLMSPPRVPWSTIPPFSVQEKAWRGTTGPPGTVSLTPITCPLGVTSTAVLTSPPRVPRSTMPPARVHDEPGELAVADHLAAGTDGAGEAAGAEGAEVDHPARLRAGEGVGRTDGGRRALADHLAACVHAVGGAEGAAEGAEVDHPARAGP